ncbi:MAG: TonB-dependent receptor [Undibacterium sp.]|nr:TonB-dependent receptor [Opitutaceae bacterium]
MNKNDDNGGYRIRGITSSVSRSRNFFLVSGDQIKASSDLYNVDRITTSRGPNAILFGDADPAGVIDVSTKKANLNRNLGEFAQQEDSYGAGKRASFDWNHVILPGRLALRVDRMYRDVNGFRRNSPQRDRNVDLMGAAVLVKKENYGLSAPCDYKNDNGTCDYMRVNQRTDQFPYCRANGSPVVGAYSAGVRPTYATGTKAFATSTQPVWIAGASVNLPTMNWVNSGVSNSATLLVPNLGRSTAAANLPRLDTSAFALHANLYGPNAARQDNNARYRTLSLTQRFGQDFYVEAAYNEFVGHKWRPRSSGGFTTIMIDPNAFLPSGAANPNQGKYFFAVCSGWKQEAW